MTGNPPTLTFSDNLTPSVGRSTYTIKVSHVLPDGFPLDGEPPPAPATQEVQVTGLRLALGDNEVHGVYPPRGSNGPLHHLIPHIALERRIAPWETRLNWGEGDEVNKKRPWLAVLLFTAGEIVDDPLAAGLTTAGTVKDLLVDAQGLALPAFDPELDDHEKAQQVRTIRLTKDVFAAVMPKPEELAYLAHVRGPLPGKDDAVRRNVEYSFVAANRVPSATGGPYVAHLVSLEGHVARIKDPRTLTTDVRLLSLYSWTFTATPDGKAGFTALREGLTAPGDNGSRAMLLRMPQPSADRSDNYDEHILNYAEHIKYRLANGWAPLRHDSTVPGDFAWYRGPFTPYQITANTDDDKYGVADLSYKAAFALGRGLVLADQELSAAFASYLDRALTGLTEACRITAPLLDADALAAGDEERLRTQVAGLFQNASGEWQDAFASVVGGGEPGYRFADVLTAQPARALSEDDDPVAVIRAGDLAVATPPMTALMNVFLGREEVLDLIATRVLGDGTPATAIEPRITEWLHGLRRLEPVPFDHLVPHAAMLPPESLRLFRLDPGWVSALVDGAFSAAHRSPLDDKPLAALKKAYLELKFTTPVSGMLIRSQMVSAYPEMHISVSKAQADGSAETGGTVLRTAQLAPDVRLCLFDGLPKDVVLQEPMQGLHVGTRTRRGQTGDWVNLRSLVKIAAENLEVGTVIPDAWSRISYRSESGPGAYTLDINAVAQAAWAGLATKYKPQGATAMSPGQLALQLVQSPEKATMTILP